MPFVTYIQPDGIEKRINVAVGTSVMLGAIQNNIRGIEAECGGSCSCATCHVYVDPAFFGKLTPPDETEKDLLTGVAAERKETSRLSCQIEVKPELDGLIVRLPDRQT